MLYLCIYIIVDLRSSFNRLCMKRQKDAHFGQYTNCSTLKKYVLTIYLTTNRTNLTGNRCSFPKQPTSVGINSLHNKRNNHTKCLNPFSSCYSTSPNTSSRKNSSTVIPNPLHIFCKVHIVVLLFLPRMILLRVDWLIPHISLSLLIEICRSQHNPSILL